MDQFPRWEQDCSVSWCCARSAGALLPSSLWGRSGEESRRTGELRQRGSRGSGGSSRSGSCVSACGEVVSLHWRDCAGLCWRRQWEAPSRAKNAVLAKLLSKHLPKNMKLIKGPHLKCLSENSIEIFIQMPASRVLGMQTAR